MKRPLIIGLSLAFVAFTTAASITSTVAWFSTTRVLVTSAGTFSIKQPDGNLDAEIGAGVGTLLSEDGKTVKIRHETEGKQNFLLDASVNMYTKTAYRLNSESSGDTDKYDALGTLSKTNWMVKTTTEDDVETDNYAAVSWTITFKYEFREETSNVGVYLNLGSSEFTHSATPRKAKKEGQEDYSYKGFRIAFIPDTYVNSGSVDQPFVWGYNDSAANTLKYVSGIRSEDAVAYSNNNYVKSNGSYTLKPDGPGNTGAPERICTLSTSDTSCEVTCIAWFEGEDINVVEGTQMDIVSAYMSFYVRSDIASS